jgi:sugar phosphate isomerase/epimerase
MSDAASERGSTSVSVMTDPPPLSVGEYTTPHLSFRDDLRVYREAGMAGIGIDAGLKLGGRETVSAEDLDAFRASGLAATFCFPGISTILPLGVMRAEPEDPDERVEAICRSLRGLSVFDPVCFVCGTGPKGTLDLERAREISVSGLQRVARAAADIGATIAIEPMHSSIADLFSFVTDLPAAVAVLDDIAAPNTGILVDVWHLWDTENLLQDIRAHVGRIVGVHVNDWRDPTRGWGDRALPGDGVADVRGILGVLDDAGYRGWYELEIFSDDGTFGNDFEDSLWKLDPVELLREGRRRFDQVWQSRRNDAARPAPNMT